MALAYYFPVFYLINSRKIRILILLAEIDHDFSFSRDFACSFPSFSIRYLLRSSFIKNVKIVQAPRQAIIVILANQAPLSWPSTICCSV